MVNDVVSLDHVVIVRRKQFQAPSFPHQMLDRRDHVSVTKRIIGVLGTVTSILPVVAGLEACTLTCGW